MSNRIITNSELVVQPPNYRKIDEFLSRSAQPNMNNLLWLRKQETTDVLNLRTMIVPKIEFDEEKTINQLDMNYHSLPTTVNDLNKKQNIYELIDRFFSIVEKLKTEGRKLHVHCKAGADRTGFFSLIYKQKYHIDDFEKNASEMLELGHNQKIYPDVIEFARKISKNF